MPKSERMPCRGSYNYIVSAASIPPGIDLHCLCAVCGAWVRVNRDGCARYHESADPAHWSTRASA
jgi:hypothetical protein